MRRRVAIAGAGPQGLTVAAFLVAAGIGPDDLVVVDPSGTWLTTWRANFRRLGIEHLRSPFVHHPHPEPHALGDFAAALHRTGEFHQHYRLPGSGLFDEFCEQLISAAGLGEIVRPASVEQLTAEGRLDLDDGTTIDADHVVWATNPAVRDEPTSPVSRHWEHVDPSSAPETVIVAGGGMTAAHLVERALDAGARVDWVTRRPINERDFDTDPGWLGPKELTAFEQVADPEERFRQVVAARNGGSVPPWMMRRLDAAEGAGRLRRHCGEVTFEADGNRAGVVVDGVALDADVVWLGIGDRPCLEGAPPIERLARSLGVGTVGGRPLLDEALRLPGSVVHVVGRLAQLQLGPAAGNLSGARRAAERVVATVTGSPLGGAGG